MYFFSPLGVAKLFKTITKAYTDDAVNQLGIMELVVMPMDLIMFMGK